MNTARAARIGEKRIQLLQLTGELDAVIAVAGGYPEGTTRGGTHYDQFVAHLRADPNAGSGQIAADRYQFPIEEPSKEANHVFREAQFEHEEPTDMSWCTNRCTHDPLSSVFPNLNWSWDKGASSFEMRKAEFGRTSDRLYGAPLAPEDVATTLMSGYEIALECLKVMVRLALSCGLHGLRIVLSATKPVTLPPSWFSDERVREQQVLINRCTQACQEIGGGDGEVFVELRGVGSVRRFVGPASVEQRYYSIHDHTLPE